MDERTLALTAFLTGSFSRILASEVVVTSGGVTSGGVTVEGQVDCARYLAQIVAELAADAVELRSVNGEPGLALRRDGHVVGVAIVHGRSGLIDQVWLVVDPERLRTFD